MPSKKRKTTKKVNKHEAFIPLLALTLLLWFLYRFLFKFPVIFDELIGKAIFFALPVILYVSISGAKEVFETFSLKKLKTGLLLGLAVGGIFGFVGALLAVLAKEGHVVAVPYYFADWFWKEMFLAVLTGFWETLFFYSFVMVVITKKFKNWSLLRQVNLVALIFLIFHLPNILLRFSPRDSFLQIILLFAFAYGQALFFSSRKNAYALVVIQAIWGMVLLVHF